MLAHVDLSGEAQEGFRHAREAGATVIVTCATKWSSFQLLSFKKKCVKDLLFRIISTELKAIILSSRLS